MHSQAKKCRKPGFSPHPSRIPPAGSLCQRPPRRMPQGFPGARGLRPALSPGHTVSLQRYGSHWGWTRGSPRARRHAAAAALPAQCPCSSHRPASPAGAGSPCLSRAHDRKVLSRCSLGAPHMLVSPQGGLLQPSLPLAPTGASRDAVTSFWNPLPLHLGWHPGLRQGPPCSLWASASRSSPLSPVAWPRARLPQTSRHPPRLGEASSAPRSPSRPPAADREGCLSPGLHPTPTCSRIVVSPHGAHPSLSLRLSPSI